MLKFIKFQLTIYYCTLIVFSSLGQQLNHTLDTVYKKTVFYNDENLVVLPDSILQYRSLSTLILSGTDKINWSIVAKQLSGFENIETLSISHHHFKTFPKQLTILNNIDRLDLRQNKLRCLPQEIKRMNLSNLDISSNNLSKLSVSRLAKIFANLSLMPNLKYLYIHDNRLSELPGNFYMLKNLEVLSISSNYFSDLPEVLYKMDNIWMIYIDCYPNLLSADTRYLLRLKGLKRVNLNRRSNSKVKPFTIEECEELCKKYPTIQFDY